jgi:hypothetical protein
MKIIYSLCIIGLLMLACSKPQKQDESLSGSWALIDIQGDMLSPFDEGERIHFELQDSVLIGYNVLID